MTATATGGADARVDPAAAQPGAGGAAAPLGSPERRPRRGRRRWILAGVAVSTAAVWYAGWVSPLTLVRHVVVEAPKGISEADVRLASGITGSDHVPAVDAERVRVAVMSAMPSVGDVEVSRSLPDTVTVRVTARKPFVALAADKGYFVMDAEGVVFDRVARPRKLPVVVSETDEGREAARQVLLSLPRRLEKRVVELEAGTRDDVTLGLEDGATVRWGSVEDAELKARVLLGLLKVKASAYDVSAPLLPTTSGGSTG